MMLAVPAIFSFFSMNSELILSSCTRHFYLLSGARLLARPRVLPHASEDGAAAVIVVVGRVHIVLLVALDQDDLGERLPHFLLR